MIAFAALLERLVFTQGRNAKVALLRRYFATQPDPDRGFGLAAVTGTLSFKAAKPALIRELAASRTDPTLFALSYDYVGDLAETVALMWPEAASNRAPPGLAEVVAALNTSDKAALPGIVAGWLDASDASARFALLKLITGGLRVGVSARLAKVALSELSDGRASADDVEEVWHGQAPPYAPLFAWLEGRAPRPDPAGAPVFRPPMLAHPLEPQDFAALDPAALRDSARAAAIEGLMLKRGDAPYVAGRPRGLWWKWKRDPLTIDAVLMYAQRGHGKRSSFYSDYTFGLWRGADLVPVGKAYSGFTDDELALLDRWIRNHTVARFGPVREVEKAFVLEIAFDAAQLSPRHKSGVALRFPRIARLRQDKPAAEADRLETLLRVVEGQPSPHTSRGGGRSGNPS